MKKVGLYFHFVLLFYGSSLVAAAQENTFQEVTGTWQQRISALEKRISVLERLLNQNHGGEAGDGSAGPPAACPGATAPSAREGALSVSRQASAGEMEMDGDDQVASDFVDKKLPDPSALGWQTGPMPKDHFRPYTQKKRGHREVKSQFLSPLDQAVQAIGRKDFARAMILLGPLTDKKQFQNPDFALAHYWMGMMNLAQKQYAVAAQHFSKGYQSCDGDSRKHKVGVRLLARLAQAFVVQGKTEQAQVIAKECHIILNELNKNKEKIPPFVKKELDICLKQVQELLHSEFSHSKAPR